MRCPLRGANALAPRGSIMAGTADPIITPDTGYMRTGAPRETRWDQETDTEARKGHPEDRSFGCLALRRAAMGALALVLASMSLLVATPMSAQEVGTPGADTGQVGEDSGIEPSQPQAEDQTDPE